MCFLCIEYFHRTVLRRRHALVSEPSSIKVWPCPALGETEHDRGVQKDAALARLPILGLGTDEGTNLGNFLCQGRIIKGKLLHRHR